MRYKGVILLLACCFAAMAEAPQTVFAPNDGLSPLTPIGKNVNLLDVSILEKDGRPAAIIRWKNYRRPWTELTLSRKIPHSEFARCRIAVQVWRSEKLKLDHFNLRLIDRDGEIVQLQKKLLPKPGWQTVSYEIDAYETLKGSWGGRVNHQWDLPLKVYGLSFGISAPDGELAIGKITVTPLEAEKLSRSVIFAPKQQGVKIWTPPALRDRQTLTTVERDGRPCLLTKWHDVAKPWTELGFKRNFPNQEFYRCLVLMDVYVPADCRVNGINLRVEDRNGEVFQLQQPLQKKSGWQTLTYLIDTRKKYPGSWGGSRNGLPDAPLFLHGVSFGFNSAAGALGFGEISVAILEAPAHISIETGNPIHVLKATGNDRPELQIANFNSAAQSLDGEYEVSDADGKILFQARLPLRIGAHSTLRLPLPRPEKYGVYYVRLSRKQGKQLLQRTMSYCFMVPSGPTPGRAKGFLFAVHNHSDSYPPREQEWCALAAGMCGAKVHRMGGCWRQPNENAAVDWSMGEHLISLFYQQGLEPQIILGGWLPNWAVDHTKKPYVDFGPGRALAARYPNFDIWGKWLRQFMEHYRGKVRFVEPWNEPDLTYFANFSAEDYVKLQKFFYQTIRQAAPEAKVMTGGYALLEMKDVRGANCPDFVQKTLTGAAGSYDIIAFHAHGSFQSYKENVKGLDQIRRQLSPVRPWWSNETAITSAVIGERAQAETLFKKLLYCWANGGIGYTWYNIRNKGFSPSDGEHNFGLLTRDFYPKQVYVAYNMLAGVYRNARFVKQYRTPAGFFVFLFQAENGDWLIPCWNLAGRQTRFLTLGNITGKAVAIDLFGNECLLKSAGSLLLTETGHSPLTIRVSGQTAPPVLLLDLLELPQHILLKRDASEASFEIQLRNPLEKTLDGSLEWEVPAGSSLSPEKLSFRLTPGESKKWSFRFRPGRVLPPHLTGRIRIDGFSLPDFQVEFCPVASLRGTVENRSAADCDFRLDKGSQVQSRVVNEPSNARLFWSGPSDLSADIWVGADQKNLTVKVTVFDDIHVQKYSSWEMWKGDSVQVIVQFPGQNDVWEFGMSRGKRGKPETWIWWAPKQFQVKNVLNRLHLRTEYDEKSHRLTYWLDIPLAAVGLKEKPKGVPFPFNVLVNDNDGDTLESMMMLAPGYGGGLRNPELYPRIAF